MSLKPKLLIVDEPTRGVDVGAKAEIYRILRKMAETGDCGIMMISSDLPEVLGVADRIIVMKDGRKVGELDGKDATEISVMSRGRHLRKWFQTQSKDTMPFRIVHP